MALKLDNRSHLIRWGAGIMTAGLLIFTNGIAASGADKNVVAPEDAAILWVDIENAGLDADQIKGAIVAEDVVQNLEFRASPAGLTAVLKDFPKEFGLRLSASEKSSARVAVTFATAKEDIVSEFSSIVELPASADEDDESLKPEVKPAPDESDANASKDDKEQPSTDSDPAESEDSSPGTGTDNSSEDDEGGKSSQDAGSDSGNKGTTAVTGASVGWAVGSAAVLLAAGIGLLAIRKRGVHKNG